MALEGPSQGHLRIIDLDNTAQILRWCSTLQCTETELREAVRMVGPSRAMVQQWIAWRHLH